MNEVEKMNEAMYERLGEIAKFASNKRVELDPDFKGCRPDDAHNRLMLGAFKELRQMVEFYKPEEKEPVVPGCPSLMPRKLPGCFDGVGPGETDRINKINRIDGAENPVNPVNPVEELKQRGAKIKAAPLTPEEQSARDREIAQQKRKIHWKVYPTKVDLCVMGKTEQNGKVYEVRIAKRGDSKVQDTYGQVKVNGKRVITCSFTGNAWMLKRILTEGTQALVNYKAKRNRDRRRNYKRRDAAAKAARRAFENGGQA